MITLEEYENAFEEYRMARNIADAHYQRVARPAKAIRERAIDEAFKKFRKVADLWDKQEKLKGVK